MYLLPFSAKSSDSLTGLLFDFASALDDERLSKDSLASIAFTLTTGRRHFSHRAAVVASNHQEAARRLESLANDQHDALALRGRVSPGFVADASILARVQALGERLFDQQATKLDELLELASHFIEGGGFPRPIAPKGVTRIHLPTYRFSVKEHRGTPMNGSQDSRPAPESTSPRPASPPSQHISKDQFDGAIFHAWKWVQDSRPPTAWAKPESRTLVVETGGVTQLGRQIAARHIEESAECLVLGLKDNAAGPAVAFPGAFDRIYLLDTSDEAPADQAAALLTLLDRLRLSHKISSPADLYLVSFDSFLRSSSTRASCLAGLGYSLSQANPEFRVRSLDVSGQHIERLGASSPDILDLILSTPPSTRGEVTRIEDGNRSTMLFPRIEVEDRNPSPAIVEGGTYVIAGGAGLVGQAISMHLSTKYNARIAWMGRRSASSTEVQAALSGAPPDTAYIQGDVTMAHQMNGAIEKARHQLGRINGAIFAASQLETLSAAGTPAEAAPQLSARVKIAGAQNFYEALKDEPLDFMCFFSSIQSYHFTSAVETPGYAMGCAWVDSYVRSLVQSPFPVTSINWGYWARSVLGTQWESKLAGRFGLLSDEEGCQAFDTFIRLASRSGLREAVIMKPGQSLIDLLRIGSIGTMRVRPERSDSRIRALWKSLQLEPLG